MPATALEPISLAPRVVFDDGEVIPRSPSDDRAALLACAGVRGFAA